jgi:hypothetical protein
MIRLGGVRYACRDTPAFRHRALDLVAQGNLVGQVVKDLWISESCLQRWMSIDDVDPLPHVDTSAEVTRSRPG